MSYSVIDGLVMLCNSALKRLWLVQYTNIAHCWHCGRVYGPGSLTSIASISKDTTNGKKYGCIVAYLLMFGSTGTSGSFSSLRSSMRCCFDDRRSMSSTPAIQVWYDFSNFMTTNNWLSCGRFQIEIFKLVISKRFFEHIYITLICIWILIHFVGRQHK